MVAFPNITFGEGNYHGHKGKDYPASVLTSCDAQDNIDSTGNGYELVKFEGVWMTQLSKNYILADRESEFAQDRQAIEQEFRDSAGFVTTIE